MDIRSGGYGILDVAFRPGTDEVWAAIGGGTLYVSRDGGQTWKRDNQVSKVGANIYKIKFFSKDSAFALGATASSSSMTRARTPRDVSQVMGVAPCFSCVPRRRVLCSWYALVIPSVDCGVLCMQIQQLLLLSTTSTLHATSLN